MGTQFNFLSGGWLGRIPTFTLAVFSSVVIADAQSRLLIDPFVRSITGFELYRNGLYWWTYGYASGEFSEPGAIAYRAFVSPSVLRTDVSVGDALSGGFTKGGAIAATLTMAQPLASANHYLLRDDYSVGPEMVRDASYAYYVRAGQVRRKALHLGPTDAEETLRHYNPGTGITLTTPIAARGVSRVEAGWVYYWNISGSSVILSRTPIESSGVAKTMATFSGTGVRKLLLADLLERTGPSAGRYFIILTQDGSLYRVPFGVGAQPQLVARGISDFTVRDEQVFSSSPLRLYDSITRIYAGTFDLSNTRTGRVIAYDALTLSSVVEYDSRTAAQQIRSVASDDERLFLTLSALTCGGLGCQETGGGSTLSRRKPRSAFGTTGAWSTIAFESGRNLRSNGQWLYYLKDNEIRMIRSDAPAIEMDLRARGLEVVQVVQDLNHSVPLVAGKATTVRGYADILRRSGGAPGSALRPDARLTVWHEGLRLGEVAPYHVPTLASGVTLGALREDGARSYLFDVPSEWIRAGNMRFEFEVNPRNASQETGVDWRANNVASVVVTCRAKEKPALIMAPMRSQVGGYDPHSPGSGFWDILHRAEYLLPISGFRVYIRGGEIRKPVLRYLPPPPALVMRSFQLPGDATLAWLWLAVVQALDKSPAGAGSDRHYVGMFPMAVPGFNGLAGVANRSIGELFPGLPGLIDIVVGDIEIPPNALSNSLILRMSGVKELASAPDWSGPRGGYTLAHELGHNYGRFHIPFGNSQFPEGPFDSLPYNLATFGPTDYDHPASPLGFDWFSGVVVRPDQAGDLMSYADLRWPSRETYRAIMDSIPDAQGPHFPPASVQALGQAGNGETLLVQGTITANFSAAAFGAILQLAPSEADPEMVTAYAVLAESLGTDYPLRLRQLDKAGNTIYESPLVTSREEEPGVGGGLVFLSLAELAPSLARVEVVVGDKVIGHAAASASPPVVNFDPVRLEDGLLEVSWTATDLDGDLLSAALQYSADGGHSWDTLLPNHGGASAVLDASQLAGSAAAQFRIYVSDGFHTARALSAPFMLPTKAPQCTIRGLVPDDRLAYGEIRSISGAAHDAEDGPLEVLRWRLEGLSRPFTLEREGATLLLDGLSPGAYRLELSAMDSDGTTGRSEVEFEVQPFAIPETTLTPTIDGIDADAAYTHSPRLRLPLQQGGEALAVLAHRSAPGGGFLYVCITGLAYGAPGQPAATAGLTVEVDASGGATAQFGELGFFVDENGVPWQTEGTGAGAVIRARPVSGADVAIVRNLESWSVEWSIPDSLLGGWDRASGLFLSHAHAPGEGGAGTWPPGAAADAPESWTPGELGSAPPPPNRPPVADAGPDRLLMVGQDEILTLDGGGSYDVDDDPLEFVWTQVDGPPVVLMDADSPQPSFLAPFGALPATLRFRLEVREAHGQGSSADEVELRLAAVVAQPVEVKPAIRTAATAASLEVVLDCDAATGTCVQLETSVNLVDWEFLVEAVVDLRRQVRWSGELLLHEGGRLFFRAVRCAPENDFALLFTTDADELVASSSTALNPYPMSVVFWMRTSLRDAPLRGVLGRYVDGSLNGYSIFLRDGSLFAWYFRNGTNFVYRAATNEGVKGGMVADGRWHHVAFVVDATGGRLYVDGNALETLPWTGSPGAPSTAAPWQIGRYDRYPDSFRGELDEISLWRIALAPEEVASLRDRAPPHDAPDLVAYWSCDDGDGDLVRDSSAQGHDAARRGEVRFIPSSAPNGR